MASDTDSSCTDVHTPDTVTETVEVSTPTTTEEARTKEPILDDPSVFVLCLRCCVLVRIDYPEGHRMEEIYKSKKGDASFIGTTCLDCIRVDSRAGFKGCTKTNLDALQSSHNFLGRISSKCITSSDMYRKACSLTQGSCRHIRFSEYAKDTFYCASISTLLNLCDSACKLRVVVTESNSKLDYKSYMAGCFM